jgi:hypothetical protein
MWCPKRKAWAAHLRPWNAGPHVIGYFAEEEVSSPFTACPPPCIILASDQQTASTLITPHAIVAALASNTDCNDPPTAGSGACV